MRRTREILVWMAVFSLGIVLLIDGGLAGTQLDATFGQNGFIVKDFGSGEDEIFAIAPQTDGKILVVGQYDNGAVENLAVARYLPTGELDEAFSDDGIFTHSMGSGNTRARGLALQSDGKIVVAGSAEDGGHTVALVRITPEGNLDNSFADNGQLLVPIADGEVNMYAVEVAADGAILAAGTITRDGDAGTSGIVVKLTADGQPDAGFGTDGVSLLQYDYDVEIRAIALQADGKIVASGSFASSGTAGAGLLRLNGAGTVDESFGTTGQALLSLAGSDSIIHDVTSDSAGRLFVTGDVNNGNYRETFVASYKEDGTLDSAFASSGIYQSSLAAENRGQAITRAADGTLLIVGYTATDQGNDVYLLTIAPKIAAAGEGGSEMSATYITADLADTNDVGNALAVMPDGSVYVAGSTETNGNKDFALLRFIGGETLEGSTGAVSGVEGVSTAGYTLFTKAVTGITRVGAISGGIITDFGTSDCEASCDTACSTDVSPTTCRSTCIAACELPTITLRGVCYGVVENPVYKASGTEEASTTTTDSTTEITTSTTAATTSTTDSNTTIFPESGTFVFDIVRSGQTEDGSGTGSYSSDIQEITPNTEYHLRAYAVLSDDTVIYGNEVTFKTDDACFIATAAFGSMLDNHVAVLREFRDKVLMVDRIGQRFVGMYYGVSPRIAFFLAKSEVLRAVVRIILIPVVVLAYFILKTGAVTKVCLLAAVIGAAAAIARINQKTRVTSI